MTDGETIPADTQGTPDNSVVENISDLDKLKAHNAELEKELIKGRELKAEAQKLEAEKMLGGENGGNVAVVAKEETATEYRDRIDKEISEGKHNE